MEACRSQEKITNQSHWPLLAPPPSPAELPLVVGKLYMHGTVLFYIFSVVPSVAFCGVLILPFTCYCLSSPLGHASVFLQPENKSFFSEVFHLLALPSLKGFNTP